MSSIERAISIAAQAHAGQVDKAGQPYILHPLRVMLRVSTDAERMAAALHDVVEDSDVTLDQLTSEGFSSDVVHAVDALTKRPGETRIQAAHPVARVVKLADNAENLDISRIANPTARDLARTEEYKVVRRSSLQPRRRRGIAAAAASLTGHYRSVASGSYGRFDERYVGSQGTPRYLPR